MSRSVLYTSSPLLASKTPVWRSKFIVAAIALGFVGLAGRAAWVQVFGNDFFQKQGEVRFARTLELPANRGRILDRNGLLLATRCPRPASGPFPKTWTPRQAQLAELARLLGMPLPELNKKLADEDKTFVWLKRQVDEPVAQQIAALNLKGVYQRKEYRASTRKARPRPMWWASPTWKTRARRAWSWPSTANCPAAPARAASSRTAWAAWSRTWATPCRRADGRDLQLSIDSKVQFFAYQKLREAVQANKARAGSAVVLDAVTGEVLALANYPSYVPDRRQNLTGAAAAQPRADRRVRARLHDEALHRGPGAGDRTRQARHRHPDGARSHPDHRLHHLRRTSARPADGGRGDAEVQQRRHVKIALQMQPREMWETFSQAGFGQKPQLHLPRRGQWTAATLQDLAADRAGHHVVRLWPVGQRCSRWRAPTRCSPMTARSSRPPCSRPTSQPPVCRCSRPKRRRPSARCCRWRPARAAPPQGPDAGLFGGRQVGHGAQAGRQGLRHQQVPRLVHRHGADRQAAHHRGGDDRRAQRGQYYGGAVAAPVFSEVVQQTLRMMGVQPDMASSRRSWRRGGVVLMLELHHPADAAQLAARSASPAQLHADSRKVGPGDGFIAWPGAATDGRRHVPAALAQGAAACLVEHDGVDAFGFAGDAVAAYDGLKAATGPIAAAYFETTLRAPGRAGCDRHQRQDLHRLVAGTGAVKFEATHGSRAVVGTLGIGRPPDVEFNGLTTPDPVLLQRQLRRFAMRACRPAPSKPRPWASSNAGWTARRSAWPCSPTSRRTTWTITAACWRTGRPRKSCFAGRGCKPQW
jgi:cell division protein FtsI (penicillin-binding protein 3)